MFKFISLGIILAVVIELNSVDGKFIIFFLIQFAEKIKKITKNLFDEIIKKISNRTTL